MYREEIYLLGCIIVIDLFGSMYEFFWLVFNWVLGMFIGGFIFFMLYVGFLLVG